VPVVTLTPVEALELISADRPAVPGRQPLARLAQAFLKWLEVHNRPATTLASYGNAVGLFLAFAEGVGLQYPEQVSVLVLDAYLAWLRERGAKPSTLAHRRSVLISFWQWLEHEGFAERNVPAKTFPIKTPKRLPVYLEPHEIDDFLAKLAGLKDLIGRRDHTIVATFFYSGIRVSELVALRVEDVDLRAGRIRVNQGKGAKDRVTILPPRLKPILQAYLAEVRPQLVNAPQGGVRRKGRCWYLCVEGKWARLDVTTEEEAHACLRTAPDAVRMTPFLFVNAGPRRGHRYRRGGQPLLTRSIYHMIHDRARTLLGRNLSPHKLRHTCASFLLYHGAQLETIQKQLGHEDIRTTMIYLHLPQKRQEEEISRIFGASP
jgi:site-specific recombinase XerD